MLNRRLPGAYFLGSWIWLYVRGPDFELLISMLFLQELHAERAWLPSEISRAVSQCSDTRQEEVGTASQGCKGRQAQDLPRNRSFLGWSCHKFHPRYQKSDRVRCPARES